MRTAYEAAVLLAVILNRSGQSRARISAKTIKKLAVRTNLRTAFVIDLTAELAEFGWVLCELSSGGYGVIQAKALEAARSMTTKLLTADERDGDLDWEMLVEEARPPVEEQDDDE